MSGSAQKAWGVTGFEACTLAVHDLDEALGFYCGVLGFALHDDIEARHAQSASVSPPSQPTMRIILQAPGTDPHIAPADRQTIGDLMTKGVLGQRLAFTIDSCAATFEYLEAAGAEVVQEPMNKPDGTRDCAFFDPSGNLLRFTQPRRK
ncbi:VOC family protein [Nocardia ninae]|uniref:Lyase n=1 Tax=Nocardia ninae NBRC 108245 TaxID=1210091 RepID=A0A511MHZ1_9NOCA|nr:VOC family protein [Nocardia ninae]GEM40284.1 lyase [Nocardia ninae NBRC 108245]